MRYYERKGTVQFSNCSQGKFQPTEIIRNLLFPNTQSYPECSYYTCTFTMELCEGQGLCLHCRVRGTGPSVGPWEMQSERDRTQ